VNFDMLPFMKIEELKTPCAIVDLDKVESNTSLMARRMTELGVRLRPHVKTHKCVEAARLQVRGHFGGITVSTLAEASFFAGAGFRDITYAVPLSLSRIEDTVELSRAVDSLNLLLDHEQTFHELEKCASANKIRYSVLLKVDCGYHRAGVDPAKEESVVLARSMAESPHVDFRGILTHAGHAYSCRNATEILGVAEQERRVVIEFAETLRQAGIDVPEVSVGSTPTMSVAEDLEGVTETRPGNYVFYDRFQVAVGSCGPDDAAFMVLVSVIGQYPKRNQFLIDGGALSFSKDPGPTHSDPKCGYGAFYTADGASELSHLRLFSLSQEVGKVTSTHPLDFQKLLIGRKLRVIPNHSCLSAALHDRYYVVRKGDVVDEWRPIRGW
jgi:D-serine deaminase-like pyridoxal phosphate-dependent protein